MIMKVKELVKVEEVDRPKTNWEVKQERTPEPGFYIERPAPKDAGKILQQLRRAGNANAAEADEEVRL